MRKGYSFNVGDGLALTQSHRRGTFSCRTAWRMVRRQFVLGGDSLRDGHPSIQPSMKRVPTTLSPVIAVDRTAAKPLHKQIYDAYRALIIGGNLGAGQQIPSTRALAAELKISRIPVLTAYAQLLAEGYFEARAATGTFVCSSLPDQLIFTQRASTRSADVPTGTRPIARRALLLPRYQPLPWIRGLGAFNVSQPAFDQFPLQIWSSIVMRHCRSLHADDLQYGGPLGSQSLREAICTYLRTSRAVQCDPNQVMIVTGSSAGS
jgi:GntR family transcriptional regulator / MocR family aminotransferase